eukprot:6198077-Prymnesium_polylepis.1
MGPDLILSTDDNSQPSQNAAGACMFGEILLDTGNCTCAIGYELASAGCTPCSRGRYKPKAGPDSCSECPPGYHATDTGNAQCSRCLQGYYQPYPGSTECLTCASPMSSAFGSSACDVCEAGFYRVSDFLAPSAANCRECPQTFECVLNTTLATVNVLPGYWRLSATATRAYVCAGTSCLGGMDAGDFGSGYCAANYTGPLCEVCVDADKYYDKIKKRCKDCPTVTAGILRIASGFFGFFFVCLFLAWAFLKVQRESMAMRTSRLLATFVQRVRSIGPVASLKLTFSFTQIVGLIPTVYRLDLPENYRK